MTDIDVSLLTTEELQSLREKIDIEIDSRSIMQAADRKITALSSKFLNARDRNRPDQSVPPKWIAPTGPMNTYTIGYIVFHKGKNWQNTHPFNSWEPGTTNSQWVDMSMAPPGPDGQPGVLEWGVGQVVAVGDKRSNSGNLWEALIAHTTHAGWEPSIFTFAVWKDLGPVTN